MDMESISYIINTLYAIFAMTLIIFMVPGFAMLEAGIVRTKNVTAVLTSTHLFMRWHHFLFYLLVTQ